ncbi:hypothetical protein L227DRAFT_561441 [Lentinus tigrinus ALCF2SS1-6]|uniref:Uncharacterized protein n=1 Tax=Lentinus tigrinus ALCF2SS1-6 TaxID=1328759 RepID=A0A5C2SJ19_9APHY|nr:hypothetical protein L227DRAFT_561441 [Lentinus tigrinus ALCF2SS1-6]
MSIVLDSLRAFTHFVKTNSTLYSGHWLAASELYTVNRCTLNFPAYCHPHYLPYLWTSLACSHLYAGPAPPVSKMPANSDYPPDPEADIYLLADTWNSTTGVMHQSLTLVVKSQEWDERIMLLDIMLVYLVFATLHSDLQPQDLVLLMGALVQGVLELRQFERANDCIHKIAEQACVMFLIISRERCSVSEDLAMSAMMVAVDGGTSKFDERNVSATVNSRVKLSSDEGENNTPSKPRDWSLVRDCGRRSRLGPVRDKGLADNKGAGAVITDDAATPAGVPRCRTQPAMQDGSILVTKRGCVCQRRTAVLNNNLEEIYACAQGVDVQTSVSVSDRQKPSRVANTTLHTGDWVEEVPADADDYI